MQVTLGIRHRAERMRWDGTTVHFAEFCTQTDVMFKSEKSWWSQDLALIWVYPDTSNE